jgi:CDP-diacylglycerol---glycerol-3-phosphate 3-phosphatidyltransferase
VFPVNAPNVLTVVRIMLVPVLVVALLDETANGDLLAAIAALLALVSLDRLPGWVAMVIIAREFAVTVTRLAVTQRCDLLRDRL